MDTKIFDKLKLLETLPAVVWTLVMNYVVDPATFHKVGSASLHFRSILLKHRNKVLFLPAMKLLNQNWNVRISSFHLYLLIHCRKICATWKNCVDRYLQDSDHHKIQFFRWERFENYPKRFSKLFERGAPTKLKSLTGIQEFVEHFRETHSDAGVNPLVFRSLSVCNLDEDQSFMDELITLLSCYGPHVWHMKLSINMHFGNPAVFFVEKLRQVLNSLPNLRSLQIFYHVYRTHRRDLEEYLLQNPLPKLKSLEILINNGMSQQICSQLIQRNSATIRQFKNNHTLFPDLTMPNLSVLTIGLENEEHFELFKKQIFVLRLRKLEILVLVNRLPDFLHRVFNVLENTLAETLEEFSIVISRPEFQFPDKLVLPKLRMCHLVYKAYANLDFLLTMANTIEKLYINLSLAFQHTFGDITAENCNTIQLYKHRGELHKSNIWTYLPKLCYLQCHWPMTENNPRTSWDYCYRSNLQDH